MNSITTVGGGRISDDLQTVYDAMGAAAQKLFTCTNSVSDPVTQNGPTVDQTNLANTLQAWAQTIQPLIAQYQQQGS